MWNGRNLKGMGGDRRKCKGMRGTGRGWEEMGWDGRGWDKMGGHWSMIFWIIYGIQCMGLKNLGLDICF